MSNGYDYPVARPKPKRRKKKKDAGKMNTFSVVMGKSGKIFKVFKTAKVLKPVITVGSMFISTFIYAFSLGWMFAAGLVGMLFVHEMGHVVAMKRKGMDASPPVFIPMLGAAIFSKGLITANRHDEAYVGIAGPIIGSMAALPIIAWVLIFGASPLFVLIAWTALILNLFNMIPLRPLDGGRVTQAVGPKFKWVGCGLLVALTILSANPGLLLIWMIVLSEFKMRIKVRAFLGTGIFVAMMIGFTAGVGNEPQYLAIIDGIIGGLFLGLFWTSVKMSKGEKDPFQEAMDKRELLPKPMRRQWLAAYFALAGVLAALMVVLHPYLPPKAQ